MDNIEARVEAQFRPLVREDFPMDFRSTPLAEMGIDSLDFFEALMELEEALGFDVPVDELEADMTLQSLSDLIRRTHAAG